MRKEDLVRRLEEVEREKVRLEVQVSDMRIALLNSYYKTGYRPPMPKRVRT